MNNRYELHRQQAHATLQSWSAGTPRQAMLRIINRMETRADPEGVAVYHQGAPLLSVHRRPDGTLHLRPDHASWLSTELPSQPRNSRSSPSPGTPGPSQGPRLPHDLRNTLIHQVRQAIRDQILTDTGKPIPDDSQWPPKDQQARDSQIFADHLRGHIDNTLLEPQALNHVAAALAQGIHDLMEPQTWEKLCRIVWTPSHIDQLQHSTVPQLYRMARAPHPITAWHYNTAISLAADFDHLVQTNPAPMTWYLRTRTWGPEIHHSGQLITAARRDMELLGLTASSWRHCTHLPIPLIQALTIPGRQASTMLALNLMARARTMPHPRTAQWTQHLLQRSIDHEDITDRNTPNQQTALKLILRQSDELQQQGPGDQTHLLGQARNIMDYVLQADRQGQVIRPRTYASLLRRSQQWHQRLRYHPARIMEQLKGYDGPLNWDPIVQQVDCGHYQAHALNNLDELIQEGLRMNHCVATYAPRCASGTSRIYSLRNQDNSRAATVELQLHQDRWISLQAQARHNAPLPPPAQEAIRLLAETCTLAWQQRGHQPPS